MMYTQKTIEAVIDECGDFNSRFYSNEGVVRLVLEALESIDEHKALRADAERLEWIWRQGGDFSYGIVTDAPGDGDAYVIGISRNGQAATFREAIDKARHD